MKKLPILLGIGTVALFMKNKPKSSSKKISQKEDRGFIYYCVKDHKPYPTIFKITDDGKSLDYLLSVSENLAKSLDYKTIKYQEYFDSFLKIISPSCYLRYISGEMEKEELMVVTLFFYRAFRNYLDIIFGIDITDVYFMGNENLISNDEKIKYAEFMTYFEEYAQPQWLATLNSMNFTEEDLKKIDEIEEKGVIF